MPACGQSRNSGSVKSGSEKFERGVFVRVTLHVEIDEGADFFRAAQDRAQLRARGGRSRPPGRPDSSANRARRFLPKDSPPEKVRRSCPSGSVQPRVCARQAFEQFEAARGVFVRFLLAHDRFAQQIDRESDTLSCAPLRSVFITSARISPGDELPRHARKRSNAGM